LTEEVIDHLSHHKEDGFEQFVGHGSDDVGGDVDALIDEPDVHATNDIFEKDVNLMMNGNMTPDDGSGELKVQAASLARDIPSPTWPTTYLSEQPQLVFKPGNGFSSQACSTQKDIQNVVIKKKSDGGFRHSFRNLKRVSRRPAKDRMEILKILKKQAKDQKAKFVSF
jgi:hypothetical protein